MSPSESEYQMMINRIITGAVDAAVKAQRERGASVLADLELAIHDMLPLVRAQGLAAITCDLVDGETLLIARLVLRKTQ